jgi:replication factor C subunit 3/5
MSDFEDEMDIDVPISKDVTFSSDNTGGKGKRSAANLPVEAEDSLPWSATCTTWLGYYLISAS